MLGLTPKPDIPGRISLTRTQQKTLHPPGTHPYSWGSVSKSRCLAERLHCRPWRGHFIPTAGSSCVHSSDKATWFAMGSGCCCAVLSYVPEVCKHHMSLPRGMDIAKGKMNRLAHQLLLTKLNSDQKLVGTQLQLCHVGVLKITDP